MMLALVALVVAIALGAAVWWWRRRDRDRRLLKAHTIAVEELYGLRAGKQPPRLFDVRQPLDLLAYSEIIPGAVRISPKDVMANPSLIPKDEDAVVYCTCPGDKTAIEILERALGLGFQRVRILKGGLGAWKAKGYPVEPYTTAFHLDTPV